MNATKNETISARDFQIANFDRKLIVEWKSLAGLSSLPYKPEYFEAPESIDDLTGTVDANGDWAWSGDAEESASDSAGNTITRCRIYADAEQFDREIAEYESEG